MRLKFDVTGMTCAACSARVEKAVNENGVSFTISLFQKYLAVKEGLKLYPNNQILLMHSLETGIALSYPENEELYDAEHAEDIYNPAPPLLSILAV